MPIFSSIPYRPRGSRMNTYRKKRKVVRKTAKRPVSAYVKENYMRRKTGYRPRYKPRYGSRVNTRKMYVQENKSTENQVISLKMPGRRITALSLARSAMSPIYYRVQGVSQYDTSTGYYPISQRTIASLNGMTYTSPLHLWEITAVCNIDGSAIFLQPQVGWGAGWTNNTGTGTVVFNALNSQNAAGIDIGYSMLQTENVASSSVYHGSSQFRNGFHCWTNIKLNLYGVRKRATRYLVQVVMFKDADATDPLINITTPVSTSVQQFEQKAIDMVDYLVKPFVYNNILLGDVQARQYIKVLKSYDVTIDPIQTTEYGGETATPHIQTVNIFMRHNKNRRFDWLDTGGQSAPTATANWEQNINGVQVRPNAKSRVYLMIRAMSPDNNTGGTFTSAANPIQEPSYDLIMRHKYLKPI